MASNFMTTFTQLNARLKNFLMGWLLVLGLKACLVECATLCVKSEVILPSYEFVMIYYYAWPCVPFEVAFKFTDLCNSARNLRNI